MCINKEKKKHVQCSVVKEFMSLGLTDHSGQEVVSFISTQKRHAVILLFCILTTVNLPKYIKIFLGRVLNLTVPDGYVVV